MNKGFLKLIVSQQLLQEPSSGYTIVKTIQQKTGWKPSFGSIYPLLSQFEELGYVTIHASGKSKVYTLTPSGKAALRDQMERRERAHAQILEHLKLLATLGDEDCGTVANMLEHTGDGHVPLSEVPEAVLLRKEMLRLLQEGKVKSHAKEVRAILSRTVKELKAV
jgi:DNA-binding PadR family transcriptional regulator